MRNGQTHNVLTYHSMPRTKKKLIRKVNYEIDNPSPFYKQFKRRLGLNQTGFFDVPYLHYYPHRRRGGHDFTDAIYFASKYGQEGFEVWLNHTAQDMMSDTLVQNHGSFIRNIIEDTISEYNRPKYRRMMRKRSYYF